MRSTVRKSSPPWMILSSSPEPPGYSLWKMVCVKRPQVCRGRTWGEMGLWLPWQGGGRRAPPRTNTVAPPPDRGSACGSAPQGPAQPGRSPGANVPHCYVGPPWISLHKTHGSPANRGRHGGPLVPRGPGHPQGSRLGHSSATSPSASEPPPVRVHGLILPREQGAHVSGPESGDAWGAGGQ